MDAPLQFDKLETRYTRADLGGEAFMCSLACLNSKDYRDVYEPNEDTYLLIDALNLETKHFLIEKQIQTVLEVGVGSGAVINSLFKMLERASHPQLDSM